MKNLNFEIHPLLHSYIKSIEIIEHGDRLESYKIYPTLFAVMGFQYQGQIAFLPEKGQQILLHPVGITGLLKKYRTFQSVNPATKTLLIKFYPWGIPAIFNEPAYMLTGQSYGLADLIKKQMVNIIEERLQSVKEPKEMARLIQEFLLQLYLTKNKGSLLQQRLIYIAQQIGTNPTIRLEKIALEQGYSIRTLERHFHTIIGLSPKRFMLTARFQKVLQQLQQGKQWDFIADHLNYYDQSHFIKEFKQFTGAAPQQFIHF